MAARKAGLFVASGTAYCTSVYLAYLYVSPQPKNNNGDVNKNAGDNDASSPRSLSTLGAPSSSSSSSSVFSYVTDPRRTQTFQKIASAYDDQIGKDELVMGVRVLRRALVYAHARGDVLEVGAGTGRNLDYYHFPRRDGDANLLPQLLPTVDRVTLTDTSDNMLAEARRKIKARWGDDDDDRIRVRVADAGRLDYDNDSFDTVIDTFGLCSFDDPVAVLRELRRVCRPDGRILLLEHGTTKDYEGLADYLDRYAERHARNWGCVWNRDIRRLVEEAGLEVETSDTWHFGTTYYLVCRPGPGGHKIHDDKRVTATCSCHR